MITLSINGAVLTIDQPGEELKFLTAQNCDFRIKNETFILEDNVSKIEYWLGPYTNVSGFASKADLITYLQAFLSYAGSGGGLSSIIDTNSSGGSVTKTNVSLTPEQLTASVVSGVSSVIITAADGNTGWLRIGFSDLTTTSGVILYAGESIELKVNSLPLIYVVAEKINSNVSLTYFVK